MKDSRSELWIRDLASLDARAISGTAGAVQPFWSPDSRSLAFFSNGKLRRVSLDSGAPSVTLADAPDPCGGTWSQAGTIVFQPEVRESSLMRVSADGGRVQPATEFDVKSDAAHRWPAFLPDGMHFLYFVQSELDARRGIYVGSIADPNALPGRWLLAGESGATFVPRAGSDVGTLLTVRSSRVEARPFDARSLSFAGGVSNIALPAVDASPRFPALLGASADVLAAAATPIPFGVQLVMMSMSGERLQPLTGAGLTGFPRLSPDGRRLARTAVDTVRGNADLWVQDLDRGTELRLTTGREVDVSPAWSPKGDRIAYRAGWGETHLAVVNADGTGTPVRIDCPRSPCEPTDWSIDGRALLINAGTDVWTVPLDPRMPPSPLLSSAFIERDARYSPDGRWVAYVSDESGRLQVSIRSVTGPQRRIIVSNQGGDQPVWSSDGSTLLYLDHEHLLQRVSLHPSHDGGLTLGRPERVRVPHFAAGHWGTTYAVSPDGTRIVLPQPPQEQAPREITIVIGWPALLK
jgi:Tol biopolymer transport system component